MTDVSGIPNLGIPAMQYGTPVLGGNAATGQPAMSAADINRSIWGSFSPQQGQAVLNNAYGPMGFGGQTAAYSALGAAYGRGTGGFNGGQQVAPAYGQTIDNFNSSRGVGEGSPASVDVNSSPFDVKNTGAIPYLSGGGMPFGGGGFSSFSGRGGGVASPSPSYSPGGPFQSASPGGNIGGGNVGAYFPTSGYQTPFNTPSMLNGSGRFGGGPQAGVQPQQSPVEFSPNQQDFGGLFGGLRSGLGRTAQSGDVSQTPFAESVYQGFPQFTEGGSIRGGSNTGGANPFTSGADPISNTSSPFGRGLQAQQLSPFDVGTTGIGGTMLPAFTDARPGGGIGRGQAPPDYAPSSPFEGGGSPFNYAGDYQGSLRNQINQKTMGGDVFTGENNPPFDPSAPSPSRGGFGQSSPFVGGAPPVPFQSAGGQAFPAPGIGGYRGNIRDQIAAVMSGSQGMNEPTSGPPLVNGGPQVNPGLAGGPPTPTPTQPQMDSAWSRIRSGPGSPGVSSVAQQTPPPEAPYAKINQAIFDIGNASRPDMFDNLSRPLGSMFSPSQYRGR